MKKKSISTRVPQAARRPPFFFFTEIQFFKVHAANECRVQAVTHLFLKKLHGKLFRRNNRRKLRILTPLFFTGNHPRLLQIPAKEKGQIQTGTCFGGSR